MWLRCSLAHNVPSLRRGCLGAMQIYRLFNRLSASWVPYSNFGKLVIVTLRVHPSKRLNSLDLPENMIFPDRNLSHASADESSLSDSCCDRGFIDYTVWRQKWLAIERVCLDSWRVHTEKHESRELTQVLSCKIYHDSVYHQLAHEANRKWKVTWAGF